MSFTLKDIKGAVIKKSYCSLEPEFDRGYNQAINTQATVTLRLNREKLIEVLDGVSGGHQCNCSEGDHLCNEESTLLADAIIAADKEIVELDKE